MARPEPPWWNRRTEALVYLLAGVSYVALGVFHKWLLNWIIGPLWLVAFVVVVPAAIEWVRRRVTNERDRADA